jgi:capsular polysaccharide biosynthesis protein
LTHSTGSESGLRRDLGVLRRLWWIPVLTVFVGIAAGLAAGWIANGDEQARFRANVVVNALPPLFGPPVLPGPFDYAAIATSDEVIERVAAEHGMPADDLRPRLAAEVRPNTSEIDFTVTGESSLAIATTWNRVFGEEASAQTPAIQARLTAPYILQQQEAAARLDAASAQAAANPDDPVARSALAAAEENFETASRLVQSYDIVRQTMTAQSFTVRAPHEFGAALGPPAARVAAGAVAGLVIGVLLVLTLDLLERRRASSEEVESSPPSLRRVEERTGSSR